MAVSSEFREAVVGWGAGEFHGVSRGELRRAAASFAEQSRDGGSLAVQSRGLQSILVQGASPSDTEAWGP